MAREALPLRLERLRICEALAMGLVLCALSLGAAEGGVIEYAVGPRHTRSSSLCTIYCRRAADGGSGSSGRLVHLCYCAPLPEALAAAQRGSDRELRLGSSFARKNPLIRWG